MSALSILLGASLVATHVAPARASTPSTEADATRTHVTRARLSVEGTPRDAFTSALALRLPGVELVAHDASVGPATGLDVFVDIRATAPHRFALTIVTADGRAFDRVVDVDPSAAPDDVTRLLASHAGNLVAGIEAGTVEADRRDVPMPQPEPAVVCPTCPEPPVAAPTLPPEPAPAVVPPRFEIGVHAQLGAILGLGAPTDTDRFSAWGGDVGLRMRSRKGLVALVEARIAGRETAYEQRLVRMRVGLGIGYAWRGDHVELETLALATVEPWTLRGEGGGATSIDDRRIRPILGGALRFVPGFLAQPSPRVRLRVGPKVELAFSSAVGDRGEVIQLVVVDEERDVPIGRLAGLELDLGVELVVWFDPRRTTRRSSPLPRSEAALRSRPARGAAAPR